MKKSIYLIFAISIFIISNNAFSSDIYISPDAPKDTPSYMSEEEIKLLMPYIKKAKNTYPHAKKRFLTGLPNRHTFFVTTRIMQKQGINEVIEQVFVAVSYISDGKVTGRIWNDNLRITNYRKGDYYTFPEKDIIDWLITKPDGTEEGNYVGKFLDEYWKNKK